MQFHLIQFLSESMPVDRVGIPFNSNGIFEKISAIVLWRNCNKAFCDWVRNPLKPSSSAPDCVLPGEICCRFGVILHALAGCGVSIYVNVNIWRGAWHCQTF